MPPVTPQSSSPGASSALGKCGWNLALAFQEVFTAIVRIRSGRAEVRSAEAFRDHVKKALQKAKQEALVAGYSSDDVNRAKLAVVALLDESALGSPNPKASERNGHGFRSSRA